MRIKADQMMAIERFLVCSVYGSSGNTSVFSDVEGVVVDEVEEERASFAKEESMLNLLWPYRKEMNFEMEVFWNRDLTQEMAGLYQLRMISRPIVSQLHIYCSHWEPCF